MAETGTRQSQISHLVKEHLKVNKGILHEIREQNGLLHQIEKKLVGLTLFGTASYQMPEAGSCTITHIGTAS